MTAFAGDVTCGVCVADGRADISARGECRLTTNRAVLRKVHLKWRKFAGKNQNSCNKDFPHSLNNMQKSIRIANIYRERK